MKLLGKKLEGPNVEVVVIPRSEEDLVFKAQAVLAYDEFDALCPLPKPPTIMKPGGETFHDTTDPGYQAALDKWAMAKTHYQILKSLEATEGLEWETVKMGDKDTWPNYREELEQAGFSPAEIALLVNGVATACGLNQERIDEARKRFLAGRGVVQEKQSSPSSEPSTTPSGKPASDSE